jgi:hypothetical protein
VPARRGAVEEAEVLNRTPEPPQVPLHRLSPGQPGRVAEGRGVGQLPCEVVGDQSPPRRGVRDLSHSGQARNAIAATRRSSARLAPPTAWTAIPCMTATT